MAQTIIVDTTPGYRMPTIYYSQGDIGRTFSIDLQSRFGESLPASPTITIQATKPSGLGFSVASTSISGAVVTFTVTETMSNEAGRFPAELKIVKNSVTLFTANFYIDCEANAHPEGTTDGDIDHIMPKFMSVTTTTLPAGDSATYSYDPETNTATFGIPKGADGSLASQVLAADYSSSKTYAVGDYVYYNGNLYRCSTAITTAEAWTSGHWTQVALGDDVSDLKSDFSEYGAVNLKNFLDGTYHPGALTLDFSRNTVDITGSPTGSGYTHCDMYRNASAFPDGLSAGQTVQFTHICEDNNVHLRFFEFVDGTEILRVDIAGTGTVQHTISDTATGCTFRYSFANGHTYDHVKSTYYLFTTLTKQQIENFMEENTELFDLPDQISSIATFEENEFTLLTTIGLTNNYYWGNGGLNSVSSDSVGYYRAASTLIPVNAGDHLILKDFYLYSHEGSALIGMYDNDGHNAPGRVNCNSPYVKTITVQDNIIKYVDIEIPDGCTQVGLFIKSPTGVTECVSSYRISNYDYAFDFTDIAEDQIKEIAIEAVNGMTIEAQDVISDYYIKGEAPKLERTKKLCIIGAGQSNIDGRVPASELPNYISLPMSGMYYEKNDLTGQFTNYYPTVTNWSFDLIMSYHLIQNLGANNFYYIKWSLGGTSIDASGDGSSHWTPDYENLEPDNALILQFNKEIQKCIEQNPNDFQIGAMIWHQGEGDRGSHSVTAANNYYTNLKKVIAFCRGIAQNECLPFILGTVSHNSAQYDATVDTAIRTIAQEDPYVYLIDMKNAVLRDNYHFNASWSIYFGEKVYDALIDAKVITGTKINPSEPTEP